MGVNEGTEFEILLRDMRFADASNLLRRELSAAVLVDPRDTALWYVYADRLANVIRTAGGMSAPEGFWRDMFHTFKSVIEPRFGRVHKGHIF